MEEIKNLSLAPPPEENEMDEEEGEYPQTTLWDYLQTEQGHKIADKVVTIFADLKNTATETISSERSARLNAEIDLRKFQHKVQLGVFALAGTIVAGLSFLGKLEPGVSMLMGTMVGYFFGRGKA